MNKVITHLFKHKTNHRPFALTIIAGIFVINTFLIILTGGTPSVLAHTMYIPIIIAAFYFGPAAAILSGIIGGLLVGPLMLIGIFNLENEPLLNSLYRTVYFMMIGGGIGLLFHFLQTWLNTMHIQNEELDATLMSIGDGVVITDEEGLIESVNPKAAELLGLELDDIIGHPFASIFQLRNHKTNAKTPDPVQAVLNHEEPIQLEDHTILINHNGEMFFIEDSASPIRNSKGVLIGVVLVFHDVSDKKYKEDKILHISYHDYLTDLPNRRYFEEHLSALDQPEFFPLGVVMMDFNALKLINDAYGYDEGNVALRHVASALKAIHVEKELISRMGGDEFAMIVPSASEARMQMIKEQLDTMIATTPIGGITYSVAFGYALKHNAQTSIRTVIREAEDRMYKNKVLFSKNTRNNAIFSILNTLTDKFDEEKQHSDRVAYFCKRIGKTMALRDDEVKELELAARLHDIGKITVPDAILKKPGRLNKDEWATMTRHTVNGYQILRTADQYSQLAEYAMSHHERFDGQGYPNQLKGDAIPLFARIITVADAFEAMISTRPYRDALSLDQALNELKTHAGTQFDPEIVQRFIHEVYPSLVLENAL